MLTDNFDLFESLSLVPSSGGVFEVTINGRLIFSKKQEGRFPEENEILSQVEALRRS